MQIQHRLDRVTDDSNRTRKVSICVLPISTGIPKFFFFKLKIPRLICLCDLSCTRMPATLPCASHSIL